MQGFLPLGVCELEVEHAAVRLDHCQTVELAHSVAIGKRAEVPPIDLDLLAGRRLEAYEGPPLLAVGTHCTQVVLQDGVAAVKSQGEESLANHFRAGLRIHFKKTDYFPLERIQFAFPLEGGFPENGLPEIFCYAIAADGEFFGNPSDGLPFIVESMDFKYGSLINHGFFPRAWVKICRMVAGSLRSISSGVLRSEGAWGESGREST